MKAYNKHNTNTHTHTIMYVGALAIYTSYYYINYMYMNTRCTIEIIMITMRGKPL